MPIFFLHDFKGAWLKKAGNKVMPIYGHMGVA